MLENSVFLSFLSNHKMKSIKSKLTVRLKMKSYDSCHEHIGRLLDSSLGVWRGS
jgi:hypothetical protein